ncbi:flagellar hook-associated protein 3 [Pseudomonas sp. RL]|uniref:flagellar hook-associated protein 3 n=1 Tax=Pseudomonas sp. RL TaxID=1452718 RepID=UPI00048415F5|nr:flagellar hook-associated protein 3 [Pseudomonas sp. RL]
MRLSTNQVFNSHVSSYNKGYAELAKTHQQLTTGVRIQTPADDPVGSARLLQLEQQANLLGQYKANMTDATNSLTQEESILKSMINVAQRARDLAGHAGNGSYGDHEREAIAAELKQIENELFGLMNSKNASGEYWFSGSQSGIQPYVRNADGTYSYQGDHSQQYLQVATGTQISISDNGFDAFESAKNVSRTSTNYTGAPGDQRLHLSQGTVANQRDFDNDFRAGAPYTLDIIANADGSLGYTVSSGTPASVVDSGSYDPTLENPKINFRGVEFTLDPMLKDGESASDYATLLAGQTFEIGMAPDRFAVVGGNGTAYISGSAVDDADKYAQAFPTAGLTLEFDDASGVFIAKSPDGTPYPGGVNYTPGTGEIEIPDLGVTFTLAGAPVGDFQLKVNASSQETQNILNTVAQLRQALEKPADGLPDGNLRIREAIATALGNIDSGMKQIESTQAHIGARLNSIDTLKLENESLEVYNAETQSLIRDTDIAEATSRLVLQQTKLEAAQAAFVRVSQLSLFERM